MTRQEAIALNTVNQLYAFGRLLLVMRADLGHKNQNLTEKDVLSMFLMDAEEFFALTST